MTGNYPSPTLRRIAYDLDGTRVWRKTANAGSTPLVEDSSFMANMNDESFGTTPVVSLAYDTWSNPGHHPFVLLKFPALVNLEGVSAWRQQGFRVAVSNDTTNGVDGTWTDGPVIVPNDSSTQREWSRNGVVTSLAFPGIRWLRLTSSVSGSGTYSFGKVLLFGEYAADVSTLTFWHPTLDEEAGPDLLEYGDRPRGTSATKTFRIKNLSETLTAKSIAITKSTLSDTTPSVPGFHSFSLDGSTWVNSLNIGDLAPGAISPVISLRQTVPLDAALWLWQMRVLATPNTWE